MMAQHTDAARPWGSHDSRVWMQPATLHAHEVGSVDKRLTPMHVHARCTAAGAQQGVSESHGDCSQGIRAAGSARQAASSPASPASQRTLIPERQALITGEEVLMLRGLSVGA